MKNYSNWEAVMFGLLVALGLQIVLGVAESRSSGMILLLFALIRAIAWKLDRVASTFKIQPSNVSTNLSAIADGQFASDADVRASSARMMAKHQHSLEKMSLEAPAETKP